VVCSFNGARTIRDTLDGLMNLNYPDFEVIVVNDGSTDQTADIVAEYEVRSIATENRGLSNARNTGWQAASGEIVAFIDDDAFPDPCWLKFLASALQSPDYGAAGGLSPAPPGGGTVADCVANAPGRPVHVLLTDRQAEHIPGCNMAFRRGVLEAIGGFDPKFRAAGDDVDVCWRVQQHGWKIAYHAGALNWHHCRNSLKAYWKQQMGYGKAEALLEEKWPEKYNALGHLSWEGRVYGKGLTETIPSGRWRIYHGQWGSAPFQSIYAPAQGVLSAMPLMPEWFFVVGLLAVFSMLGLAWSPLLWAAPLLALSIGLPLVMAVASASMAEFPTRWPKRWQQARLHGILALLHLTQPPVRLLGRLRHGLTPWRKKAGNGKAAKGQPGRSFSLWSQHWRSPGEWIRKLDSALKADGAAVIPGGDFDSWDLEVRGGMFGRARILMAHEEHGEGRQQLRFIARTPVPVWTVGFALLFLVPGSLAMLDGAYLVGGLLGLMAALVFLRSRREASISLLAFQSAILDLEESIRNGAREIPGE
jgi:GT2 family glycosyltransferase